MSLKDRRQALEAELAKVAPLQRELDQIRAQEMEEEQRVHWERVARLDEQIAALMAERQALAPMKVWLVNMCNQKPGYLPRLPRGAFLTEADAMRARPEASWPRTYEVVAVEFKQVTDNLGYVSD